MATGHWRLTLETILGLGTGGQRWIGSISVFTTGSMPANGVQHNQSIYYHAGSLKHCCCEVGFSVTHIMASGTTQLLQRTQTMGRTSPPNTPRTPIATNQINAS